ncbi:hypothetical protein IJG72_06860 [bacterium]|nr:hypothetical protein [bacterium]
MIKVSGTLPPKAQVYTPVQFNKSCVDNNNYRSYTQNQNINFGQNSFITKNNASKTKLGFIALCSAALFSIIGLNYKKRNTFETILNNSQPIATCQVKEVEKCKDLVNEYKKALPSRNIFNFDEPDLEKIRNISESIRVCRDEAENEIYDNNLVENHVCQYVLDLDSIDPINDVYDKFDKMLNLDKATLEKIYY